MIPIQGVLACDVVLSVSPGCIASARKGVANHAAPNDWREECSQVQVNVGGVGVERRARDDEAHEKGRDRGGRRDGEIDARSLPLCHP